MWLVYWASGVFSDWVFGIIRVLTYGLMRMSLMGRLSLCPAPLRTGLGAVLPQFEMHDVESLDWTNCAGANKNGAGHCPTPSLTYFAAAAFRLRRGAARFSFGTEPLSGVLAVVLLVWAISCSRASTSLPRSATMSRHWVIGDNVILYILLAERCCHRTTRATRNQSAASMLMRHSR